MKGSFMWTAFCFLRLFPALQEGAHVQGVGVSGLLGAQLHPMPKPADLRAPRLSPPQLLAALLASLSWFLTSQF